jgi:peptidoglycan/xylan/chitin deacetylase (PgdA/CDA1 family)
MIVACVCVAGMLLARPATSSAQQACAANALGVSRIAEVDTSDGPWFGEPNGNRDFLAPGEVVLTFDDGPLPRYTRPILVTGATFFVVGAMAAEFPDVVQEIAKQGHTIGTHTWSHANLKRLSNDEMKAQIETTFTVAQKAAGQPIAPFFRYPYLNSTA